MGGGFGGRAPGGSLTRPHTAGLEGGARVACTLAGALLIGAGILHISAAGDHTNLPVMMVGFLVVAAAQAGLGWVLMFRRPGRLLVAGGLLLTLGALATWLVSRTAGLPFLPGGHMEPVGFKDGVTVIFEMATLAPLALLASAELDRVRLPSPRLGSQAVAFLGSAMFALFVPALLLEGGSHHSAGEMAGHAHGADVAEEDGHAHDGDELAQANGHGDADGGGHAHGDGETNGDSHGGHAATADFFSDAHDGHGGTGSHRDSASHGHGDADGGGDHPHTGGEDTGDDGGDNHHGDGDQHADGEHGDDHGSGEHEGGQHEGSEPAARPSLAFEPGEQDESGKPTRGPAVVYYDRADEGANGAGHGHGEPCEPTAEQRSAADAIVDSVRAELRQYENNPAEALRDGFDYVFGPTDRMIHVVHRRRLADPDVLKTPEIESFIYYMTDTGYVPIAGMFVMPKYGMHGPQPGGCLTQWHHHGGFVGRAATAGQSENTPEMMHVFTYPGLDPWGHYSGRDLARLWTPGAWVPSICRSAADANTGCLP